jgi:hypothetical protein
MLVIMEITYDMIIKYLVTPKSIFASKKHMTVYSDSFPALFKDFLHNKFYRYGITQVDLNNNNISFYNSLLTLLNKHFITFTNTEELEEINNFKRELKENNNITLNKNIILHIQEISNVLQINFLIFDFKNETINIIFCGEKCNPYTPTLLLANYDESFEPLIYEIDNKKLFSYNDLQIKKIYQHKLQTYPELNKEFILNDNITDIVNNMIINTNDNMIINTNDNMIINNENMIINNENISNNNIDETPSLFIKNTDKNILDEKQSLISNTTITYTSSKLLKMTKKELDIIIQNKSLTIDVNKMLKKDIVDYILKN